MLHICSNDKHLDFIKCSLQASKERVRYLNFDLQCLFGITYITVNEFVTFFPVYMQGPVTLKKWTHRYGFDIINNLVIYVRLEQLIENLCNYSHTVSISGVWNFDTKQKRVLPLIKDYLDIIYASSDNAGVAEKFEKFYAEVGYINLKASKLILK